MNHEAVRSEESSSELPPQGPITIGGLRLPNPFVLAPMAGVSERPFRVLARELGADFAPTELVSATGLLRASDRSRKFIAHDASERPFSVQLFGGDPVEMTEATAAAREAGADLVDVNMGCPVPKVTKHGAGSALLCAPERAAELIAAMVKGGGLPITVKIRAGWDARTINAPEVAKSLEGAGAAAVALHARTRAQGYSGRADWGLIAQVKRAVRIPVFGNGDVRSAADAARLMRETGCDGVMVGRAALGYPWIFRELCGGEAPLPSERGALVLRHFEAHIAFCCEFGPQVADIERRAVRQFRKHLLWYAHGLRGASVFRSHAARLDKKDDVADAIAGFFRDAEPLAPAERTEAEFDLRGALG